MEKARRETLPQVEPVYPEPKPTPFEADMQELDDQIANGETNYQVSILTPAEAQGYEQIHADFTENHDLGTADERRFRELQPAAARNYKNLVRGNVRPKTNRVQASVLADAIAAQEEYQASHPPVEN